MSTKPTAAQKAAVAAKGIAARNAAKTTTTKITTVQTTLSSTGLGDATKRAQQALSEKYGIPTFDIEGKISTVPQTRPIDTSINVGTGALTESAFRQSLTALMQQTQNHVAGGGVSLASITAPITAFIETLIPKLDLTDLTDEQRKAIQAIDEEIKEQEKIMTFNERDANAGIPKHLIAYQAAFNKIRELQNAKGDILRRYRASNQLIKEIQQQQQELLKLNISVNITTELKEQINLALKEASGLLEKMVKEGLEIPKDIIKQFNITILESTKVLQKEITKGQNEIDKKITDIGSTLNPFAFLISAFESIFNPPLDDRVNRIVLDNRASVEAYKRLVKQ